MAPLVSAEDGAAMRALVADPADKAAEAQVSKNPSWNSMLRTTCVATQAVAGHAPNALPQRAWANVNCRILPGVSIEAVRDQLEVLAADQQVKVELTEEQERVLHEHYGQAWAPAGLIAAGALSGLGLRVAGRGRS